MSENPNNTIKDFYQGRHVFYTGATGMLGTAYLSTLILKTPVACVYAIARGGESRLWNTWSNHLPLDMIQELRRSGNAQQILHPSLAIAKMALGCANLTRFVYISSAYASAFHRETSDGGLVGCDTVIKEDINHIRSGPPTSAAMEFSDLEEYGSTPEYEFVRHPYPYSYAKHLTERLLLELFDGSGRGKTLLIFRPSCIGPAESNPYPFFEVPGSSPITFCLAAVIAYPPIRMKFSSHLPDPSAATIDEIPVDMVVNRLIAHVAFESSGCVHAVSSGKGRRTIEELFSAVVQFRRFWWGHPKFVWCKDDWKSDKLCSPARLFVITGCSFAFDDTKTKLIWDRMTTSERSTWPLWQCKTLSTVEMVAGREKAFVGLVARIISSVYGLPASSTWLFHQEFLRWHIR